MQPLQNPTKTSGIIDRIGLRLLIYGICFVWFYMLWGKVAQSLLAAFGVTLLINQAILSGEARRLKKRERSLREKIGGRMAVDALVFDNSAAAASLSAGWLSREISLENVEETDSGAVCESEGRRVYLECLRKHASSKGGKDDIVSVVRTARKNAADVAILCASCEFAQDARGFAEEQEPRVKLIPRSVLVKLAGAASPATDEQLAKLGSSSRGERFNVKAWRDRITQSGKSRRFVLYGVGLFVMFLVTRQWTYAVPAAICLALFFVSRRYGKPGRLTL